MNTTTTNPARPVPGQTTLEEQLGFLYRYQAGYGSYWLIIPDSEADNDFGGVLARVGAEDYERALELVGGSPVVCMVRNGSLGFFRAAEEEVDQAQREGWQL